MAIADALLLHLRTWGRTSAGELVTRLGVSRATLMRAVRVLGPQLVSRGRARRTAYAARRAVRGQGEPLPLYRIDGEGHAQQVALLHPIHPQGCALEFEAPFDWPLDADMADGWFGGLPYLLDDMRPQGFLGRNFAHAHALLLQVPDDPGQWSEDDVLHALALLGTDTPGCHVVGEVALRSWLAQLHAGLPEIGDAEVGSAYPARADEALRQGVAGSSAGGEFPKFTALRRMGADMVHVIVKFSGSDGTPGVQRWSDLLVCEHLAGLAIRQHLGMEAAVSTVQQAGGRTFLEVHRFDRHGAGGRSPLCSWAALNAGLYGLGGRPWPVAAAAMLARGDIDAPTRDGIAWLWHFGRLIGNTDMHDGNLSFRPGLQLAPAYDMLPMLYAPQRGVEVPEREFAPQPPIPSEREAWMPAQQAAVAFWEAAAGDGRISAGFRTVCARNADAVQALK